MVRVKQNLQIRLPDAAIRCLFKPLILQENPMEGLSRTHRTQASRRTSHFWKKNSIRPIKKVLTCRRMRF